MTSPGKKIAGVAIVTGIVILLLLWWYIWKSQPRLFEPGTEPPRPLTQEEIKKAEESLTAPREVQPPKEVLDSLSAPPPVRGKPAPPPVSQDILESLSAPK